jgi:hypothetical protein
MRLFYFPANIRWMFVFGDDLATATIIDLAGEARSFETRRDAVASARRRGLAVAGNGVVTAAAPTA